MRSFKEIYAVAALHKGGDAKVTAQLPKLKTARSLAAMQDAEYLSLMSLRIFRAGLKHKMVDQKWPAFEKVFNGFDPFFCAMLSDEQLEKLTQDARIIRHRGKLNAVRHNAQFVRDQQGFGAMIADWPTDDIIGLWRKFRKEGKQLGGMSGPYFLRMAGKDTFLLTRDVIAVLKYEGVIDKDPTSEKDRIAVQNAFLQWQQESGRPLCEISRIVSFAAL